MEKTRFTMSFPNPNEKFLLQRLAEGEGYVSQAAYIRMLIRKAAKEQGLLLTKNICVKCQKQKE